MMVWTESDAAAYQKEIKIILKNKFFGFIYDFLKEILGQTKYLIKIKEV